MKKYFQIIFSMGSNLPTHEWYHVVGTYEATSGEICIYVNGAQDQCNFATGGGR